MSPRLKQYLDEHPQMCQTVAMDFDIGGGAGAWYVGHLIDTIERIASVHVAVWNKSGMRQYSSVKSGMGSFMSEHGVDRLVAEIPIDNFLAQAFAQKSGMRRVGIMKQRPSENGSKSDVVMFEAVKGEL